MKYLLGFVIVSILYAVSAVSANAVCPLCTIAVGAGLGLSRYFGIDDAVIGVWIGGFIISSGLWLADWMGRKGWRLLYKEVVSVVLFFLLIILPLYWAKMIGLPGNTLWGVDKLLFGTFVGLIVFVFGVWFDKFLRNKNDGKVYVYYQKVIIPVLLLSIAGFVLYLITT